MDLTQKIMEAQAKRPILTAQTYAVLYPHVRLHYDKVREAWALLSPEKVYWPNEISVAILAALDGKKTIEQISADLAETYNAPQQEVYDDVYAFIREWSDNWLVKLCNKPQ